MNEEIKLKERGDKLYGLFEEIKKIVPTMCFIGKCSDGVGAIYMGSPKKDPDDRDSDIGLHIYATMSVRDDIRDILLSSVSFYLTKHPDKWMMLRAKMDEIMAQKMSQN